MDWELIELMVSRCWGQQIKIQSSVMCFRGWGWVQYSCTLTSSLMGQGAPSAASSQTIHSCRSGEVIIPFAWHWWKHIWSAWSNCGLPSRRVQHSAMEMSRLEHLAYKGRLKVLELLSLEKRRPRENLSMYINTSRKSKEDGGRLLMVPSDKSRVTSTN